MDTKFSALLRGASQKFGLRSYKWHRLQAHYKTRNIGLKAYRQLHCESE